MSQQQAQAQAQAGANPASSPHPPPRPPPPEEFRGSNQGTPITLEHPGPERPPQLPPKGESSNIQALRSPPPNAQNDQPPPLPPLPQGFRGTSFQPLPTWQHVAPGAQHYISPHIRKQSVEIGSSQIPSPRPLANTRMALQQEMHSPVSPLEPAPQPAQYQYQQQQQQQQYGHPPPPQQHPAGPPYPNHQSQISGPPSGPMPAYYQANAGHPPYPASSQPPPAQQPKSPPIDLLTSPMDVTIPSQNGGLEPLPAPPIPPNPEKDALLHALSQTLVAQTYRTLESNKSAVAPLLAQQSALRNAQQVLQSELEQLQQLDGILDINERVLGKAMHEAEQVMRDAAGRRRPEVDEILVCPTVVGSQLYNLVADQKSCEEARLMLIRGLDRGRINLDVFVKQTRSLSREEFLKKALLKKVARGMGLDERQWQKR
jgi:ESCRT-I complex subunit TSG101